jgi:ribosome-associated translation inhibitor RaiA
MSLPLRLTLRHVRPSQRLREDIRQHVDALDKIHPRMLSCRVAIEMPHRRHLAGNRFRVGIELKVPGDDIIVTHGPSTPNKINAEPANVSKAAGADADSRHLYVAVNKAFAAARRKLLDRTRKQKGKTRAVMSRTPRRRA